MLPGRLTIPALFCVCALIVPQAFAQRGRGGGGRGGMGGGMQGGMQHGGMGGMQGGMQRGGMGGEMGGMQHGGMGGMQGGMQRGGTGGEMGGMQHGGMGGMQGGMQHGGMPQGGLSGPRAPQAGSASMGPYGRGGGSPTAASRPGVSGTTAASRPGVSGTTAASRPGVSGTTAASRPGVNGAAAASLPGGSETSAASRPGVGAGGVGGPASGIGVLPGAGAGLPGTPASRDYAYGRRYGTYYASDAALTAQRNTMLASTAAYSMYNPARYAGAWQANNMMNASMYANPGYGGLSGMMGMPAQPAPYDYGGNVVSQGNSMYVNGDPAGTTQEYANQASQIAETGAAEPDEKAAWQPLGVFAMVEPDQADPNDLFQLAVNAQGQVRGNYHNVQTDETTPLAGAVDRKTGRVAWTIGGDKQPIYEAGLANLTRDHCTMLVHTADGQPSQFTLLRLPDPQSAGQ